MADEVASESASRAGPESENTVALDDGSFNIVEGFLDKGFSALQRYSAEGQDEEELQRAEFLFKTVLKVNKTEPRALLGKAVIFYYQSEWFNALVLFRQVLARAARGTPQKGTQQAKSVAKLRFAISKCFAAMGRHKMARKALDSVVAVEPTHVEALCALAQLEARSANDGVGTSLEQLASAVGIDRNHPVVLLQLANTAFYLGEQSIGTIGGPDHFTSAKMYLEKVIQVSKSSGVKGEAHYQLGRLYQVLRQWDDASEEFRKAKELIPGHPALMYSYAQMCLQRKKYMEGISVLEGIRKTTGDLADTLKLLVYLYLMTGIKAQEAADLAGKYTKLVPDDVEGWAMKAEAEDQLLAKTDDSEKSQQIQKQSLEAYEHVAKLVEAENGHATHGIASPQMYNNLGTMRQLQNDPQGATDAYNKGLALIDKRFAEFDVDTDEAKDLHVAQLTMRFNRAWLCESTGEQPDHLQATQEYLAIREEHSWYADTLLRLGSQWNRVGDIGRAVQTFEEAQRHGNPVLASLMSADTYRMEGNFAKAIELAEVAAKRAGEKQYHYAHLFLGNLHFQVGSHPKTSSHQKDKHLQLALRHYTAALRNQKDSGFAANGIGMVFAARGKMDLARRTFESVLHHHSMKGEASVYINLAHTFMQTGGDASIRRAINLYEKAFEINPNDLCTRHFLAKAHCARKDFATCRSILSDSKYLWPQSLLLQYNQAINLQDYGQQLMGEGLNMQQLSSLQMACQMLSSAVRSYGALELRWAVMSDDARRDVAVESGQPVKFMRVMSQADLAGEYAQYMLHKAQHHIEELAGRQDAFKSRMEQVQRERQQEAAKQQEIDAQEARDREDREKEKEEQAYDLMEGSKEIQLGRNIALMKDPPKAPVKKAKAVPLDEDGNPLPAPVKTPAKAKRTVAPKKEKKEKKKDKKDKKKDKKRKREESSDDAPSAEVPEGEAEGGDVGETGEIGEGGALDAEGMEAEGIALPEKIEKKEKKDKKKKDKKDKKKEKKDAKRRRREASSEPASADEPVGEEGDAAADADDMEEELFG